MNTLAVSTAISSGRGELVNVRQRSLLMAKWRVLWVALGFGVIAMVAMLRIAYLGMFEGDPVNTDAYAALAPNRGDITDRNGVPLARAFPAYSLWFNPAALGDDGAPLVHSAKEVAAALVRIFPDMDQAALAARLAEGRPGYLRRRILPEDANKIHALGEPALEFPREMERFYPQGSMGAHVLGFVGADGRGHVGYRRYGDREARVGVVSCGVPGILAPVAKACLTTFE